MPISTGATQCSRATLQVNSYGYTGNNQLLATFPLEDRYNKSLLDKNRCYPLENAMAKAATTKHLEDIGITDYMCPCRRGGGRDG